MSKRKTPVKHYPEKECFNKIKYATEAEAEVAAVNLRLASNRAVHPYRCLFCRSWHAGSMERRGRRQ